MNRRVLILGIIFMAFSMILLLFGGCGGKTQDPSQDLAQAAQYAKEAGTIRPQINIAIKPPEGESGTSLNIQGDAKIDMVARVMEAKFTVMGMEISVRYVDEKAYLLYGAKWYTLTGGDIIAGLGKGTIAALVSVLSSFPDIVTSAAEVTKLGDKSVGGYNCNNLEMIPDLQAITALASVQQLADELDMTSDEILAYLQGANLGMEVCVQKDDLIIREVYIALDTELPEMGKIAGIPLLPTKAHVEITIDIPEYGVKVEVQSPSNAIPYQGS